jgi:hypothetical protein
MIPASSVVVVGSTSPLNTQIGTSFKSGASAGLPYTPSDRHHGGKTLRLIQCHFPDPIPPRLKPIR